MFVYLFVNIVCYIIIRYWQFRGSPAAHYEAIFRLIVGNISLGILYYTNNKSYAIIFATLSMLIYMFLPLEKWCKSKESSKKKVNYKEN